MLLTTLQFFVTVGLSIICARALQVTGGDLPILTFLLPIIWITRSVKSGTVLIASALLLYGLTLPVQPVELSISTWILFPLLVVAFCRRSTLIARVYLIATMLVMEMAVLYCQWQGVLSGSISATLVQISAVIMVWMASRYTTLPKERNWWALGLTVILASQGEMMAMLVSLSIVAILSSVTSFPTRREQTTTRIKWSTLLGWTLPTVAFSTLITVQAVSSGSLVLLIWVVTLGAAWICDYILRLSD